MGVIATEQRGAVEPAPATADAFRLWLSERLPAEIDPARVVAIAADGLRRYLGIARVGYGEIEPGQDVITVPLEWTDGVASMAGRRPFPRDSAIARHYRLGKTMVVADIAAAGFGVAEAEAAEIESTQTRAFVGVPLLHDGALIGLFIAGHSAPRAWTADEVELIGDTGQRLHGPLRHVLTAARQRESGARFEMLAKSMPGICWLADATGVPYWMNERGLGFHGGIHAEPLGHVHPEDSAASIAWATALAAGTSLEVTARLRAADGGWRPFLSRVEPIRDAAGAVIRWCGIQLDLSDQQRREAVLNERDRTQAFLIGWSDAIRHEPTTRAILATTLDMLGRHLAVSRLSYAEVDDTGGALAVLQQWGTGDDIVGRPFPLEALGRRVIADHLTGHPLVVPDVTDHALFGEDNLPVFLAAGVAALVSVPLVREGRLQAVLCALSETPRRWTAAEVGLVAEVADRTWAILDRARFEERLAESEALLAAFMEHAPVGMHLKDAEGRYLRINPELSVAMDMDLDEAIGRHPDDLFPPETAERIAAMEARAIGGTAVAEEFVRAPRERYAAMLSIVFPIAGDHRVKTGGFTLDLTDRKASEAALQRSRDALYQSEKLSALGSLLAGVSHELNNPLSIVVAQAVMMERQAKGTELAERAFKIRKAADRCARIVQTFLAMARQKKPERTAVDLSAVADAAIELANYGLRSDGVGITRMLTADLPHISADADQLHQIVTNLIVNAQHAMASVRGLRWLEVRTALGDEPRTVILEVCDSGPGIPFDLRRRIFEPFFTTKAQGEGTGVGLSFSQGLAEAHGGRLTLMPSERGACFRLTLPIDERNLLPRVEPAPERAAPTTLRRALIVDDEEEIAASLADFLTIEGFECEIVVGGAAAQARLAQGQAYDLVVSDLRMPDVDGPALWAWIGDQRPDLVDRTAFTTGDTLGTSAARFLAEAGRPVLEKPFMPDSIRHFLAAVVPE